MINTNEIKYGYEIGMNTSPFYKFIYLPCSSCGKYRWIRLLKGSYPEYTRCIKCAYKEKSVIPIVRFLKNITINENECWIWNLSKDTDGYGLFGLSRNDIIRAHRFSYEYFIDKIPNNLLVCHKCDTPSCVNPDHLFVGTQQDNINDASQKNRMTYGEKHYFSKLTNKQVLEIKNSKEDTYTLANKYNISISQIKRILNYKSRIKG